MSEYDIRTDPACDGFYFIEKDLDSVRIIFIP